MKLLSRDQVCNVELSKKLFELGVKQDSIFYWRKYQFCKNTDLFYIPTKEMELMVLSGKLEYSYSAFTVAELGFLLQPFMIGGGMTGGLPKEDEEKIDKISDDLCSFKNEANARAEMMIYLLEKGVIKL